jgi:hypothetical protein
VFVALLLQVPNLQWQTRKQKGGSVFGSRPNVAQECKLGHTQILCDYFVEHQSTTIAFFDVDIECVAHCSFESWRAYMYMIFILFRENMHVVF